MDNRKKILLTCPRNLHRGIPAKFPVQSMLNSLRSTRSLSTPLKSLFGPQASPPHEPTASPCLLTYRDVCRARALLSSLRLPTELVLQVLNYAEYWTAHTYEASIQGPAVATAQGARSAVAILCFEADVFTNPVTEDARRCGEQGKIKSVAFDIASRDQGWTSENSHGTFWTSSWTEVSILRDASGNIHRPLHLCVMDDPISSPQDLDAAMTDRGWSLVKRPESALQGPQDGEGDLAWYLQGNRVAGPKDEYQIRWTEGGSRGNQGAGTGEGFVRELKQGDRILVWARAKVSSGREAVLLF